MRSFCVFILLTLLLPAGACDLVADETNGTVARCTCYASRASGSDRVLDRIFELDRCAEDDVDDAETVADSLAAECLSELEENNTIVDDQQCDCECFLTDGRCLVVDPLENR